jgi:hypothetical protein
MSFTQERVQAELDYQRQQLLTLRDKVGQATVAMHQCEGAVLLLQSVLASLQNEAQVREKAQAVVQNGAAAAPAALSEASLAELFGGKVDSIVPVNA